jgi:serine/threonine-protein kinase
VVICVAENPFGVSWGADNTIFFGQSKGIMRVAANGGTPELVIATKEGEQASSPQLLPDGDSVLFTLTTSASPTRWDEAQIVVQSLRTGERTTILQGGGDARYVSTGHIVYAVGDALFAVAFDANRLAVQSGPVSLVQGISRPVNQAAATPTANYGVSTGGTLVYLTGIRLAAGAAAATTPVWVNRDGREEPIPAPPRAYVYPRISPDGTKVALDVRDQQLDIWIWDLLRQTLTRLTFDPGEDEFPAWSPDGKRVANTKTAEGTPGRDVQPLLETMFAEANPALSPDGRWLAYQSDESGRAEIYVRPFPDVDAGRWQVSTGGGVQVAWARSGRELFYRNGAALLAVPVQTGTGFVAGTPKALFEGQYVGRYNVPASLSSKTGVKS